METCKEQKVKKAKFFGSMYFVILGLINFGATLLNGEFRWLDLIILSLAFLPLLINKKTFFLLFGLFAGFISLYMGFACLTFNLNPEIHTSQVSFLMGYLLAAASLFSSLLLIYVGFYSSEKNKFGLI